MQMMHAMMVTRLCKVILAAWVLALIVPLHADARTYPGMADAENLRESKPPEYNVRR
jgi:hypothetical protein